MIVLKEETQEDRNVYEKLYEVVERLTGKVKRNFVKINRNGKDYIVYEYENKYTVFYKENGRYVYHTFLSDGQGKVIEVLFNQYVTQVVEGNSIVFTDTKTKIRQSLNLIKRSDLDKDGYDANVDYTQYNPNNDVRVIISYQQMFNTANKIYDSSLQSPIAISLETEVRARDNGHCFTGLKYVYSRDDYNVYDNPILFNATAIAEHGLLNVLQNGAVEVMNEYKISRYRKLMASIGYSYFVPFLPFCRAYQLEELFQYIKNFDLKTEVPPFMLSYYNKETAQNREVELFEEIAQFFEIENLKEKGPVLKFPTPQE